MPKGQSAKGIKRAKKQMIKNKQRFIKNNPHRSRNGGEQQRQSIYHHIRDFVIPQLDNDRDKKAVEFIFKLINIDKVDDEVCKKVIEQNLHIPFIRDMWLITNN